MRAAHRERESHRLRAAVNLGSQHGPRAGDVPKVSASEPRVLVLGLGEPTEGNHSLGVRLAGSMSASLRGVEVRSANEFVSYAEILHDYDLIVVLNSISFCDNVGRVSLGSSYSLADGWGSHPAHAEAFSRALAYARLMGHRLPRIEVVNVCVGPEEWPEPGLSPAVASAYRGILSHVRALVRQILRAAVPPEASTPG